MIRITSNSLRYLEIQWLEEPAPNHSLGPLGLVTHLTLWGPTFCAASVGFSWAKAKRNKPKHTRTWVETWFEKHGTYVKHCETYMKQYETYMKIHGYPPTPLWRCRRAYRGANSYTKCSITFVIIAVAISALAEGGTKTISHRDLVLVVSARFFDDFWVSELKRPWKRNFGSFWSASGKGKTDRNEKTLQIAILLNSFWMPEHWKHCKNQCFGPTLSRKTCKLRCFWQKKCKNTEKNNVLDGFFVYMFELASGIGTWKNWRKQCK